MSLFLDSLIYFYLNKNIIFYYASLKVYNGCAVMSDLSVHLIKGSRLDERVSFNGLEFERALPVFTYLLGTNVFDITN